MEKTIEYYFSPLSGYAYLGHQAFLNMVRQAGAVVENCPVDIVKVVAASGATPPAKQSEARLSYRREDMARSAKLYGLPINTKPKFWSTESALACRAIIAAKRLDIGEGKISAAILNSVWVQDEDISDGKSLQTVLDNTSLPGSRVLEFCDGDAISSHLDLLTNTAIEKGVFGSPTYIFDNKRYWGQDRLAMLQ